MKKVVYFISGIFTLVIIIAVAPLFNSINKSDLEKDIIFPSIVALLTVITSLLTTLIFNWYADRRKRLNLESDTKLRLEIEFTKIISILDNLLRNIEEKKIYEFKTLDSTVSTQTFGRLNALIKEVHKVRDETLRVTIINTADTTLNLLDEIRFIETRQINSYNAAEQKKKQSVSEFKSLEITLLGENIGIKLDPTEIHSLSEDKILDSKNAYIKQLIQRMYDEINMADKELANVFNETQRLRALYVSRITSLQNKIKDLLVNLK